MNKINTNPNSAFPDQVVSDAEKATLDYGYQVGRAIEGEWFGSMKPELGCGVDHFECPAGLRAALAHSLEARGDFREALF